MSVTPRRCDWSEKIKVLQVRRDRCTLARERGVQVVQAVVAWPQRGDVPSK